MTRLPRHHKEPVRVGHPRRSPWVRVAIGVVLCFATAAVLHVIFTIMGVGAPYLFVVSLLLCLAALRGVLGSVAAPPLPRTLRDAPAPPAHREGIPEDGIRVAVSRWETRLDWTRQDITRFASIAWPAFVDIVDERLRLRHGTSRTDDPVRARELLGPELWTFVHEPVSRSLTPQDMAALVARMEAL